MDKITMIEYNSVKGQVYYAIGSKPLYIGIPTKVKNKVVDIRIVEEEKRLIEIEVEFVGELCLTIVANREDVEIWYTSQNDDGSPHTLFSLPNDYEPDTEPNIDDLKPKNL